MFMLHHLGMRVRNAEKAALVELFKFYCLSGEVKREKTMNLCLNFKNSDCIVPSPLLYHPTLTLPTNKKFG